MDTLGERIAELRRQMGMNRPRLAREADVSYSFLVQVETGQRENPQADKLAKVAKVLGVPVDVLLALDQPLPTAVDTDIAEIRRDLITRINAMDEAQLLLAAKTLDGIEGPIRTQKPDKSSANAKKSAPSAARS
jgi:transcriptional regulator with XRE-family HTH domain